jgi:hypothetical protein
MRLRRPKRAVLGFLLAAPCITWAAAAAAREPGVGPNFPPGSSLAVPAGVNPPPGLTLHLNNSFYSGQGVGIDGSGLGYSVSEWAVVPQILWNPGWTVLGASYMAFVTQPLLSIDLNNSADPAINKLGHSIGNGFANTAISPINLSWTIAQGLFFSAGFTFYGPDGTYAAPVNTLTQFTINPGANFWTFEPSLALSYLRDGYNITVHTLYETNTENPTTRFRSGDQIFIDFTAAKHFGSWELGPVAYAAQQVTADRDNMRSSTGFSYYAPPPPVPDSVRSAVNVTTTPAVLALGLLVGHQFGSLSVRAYYTGEIYAHQTTRGSRFWLDLTYPLGGAPPK